ncbi:hypothetical protein Fot_36848 [Forsythia ovata]|uniref:Uncharacterized protein n=1 Tax=Forsythia ovata TaxID=205694 RepID=A0ABD1SQL4_9LAMI
MEGFFRMKSVDDALAPPPGFPPKKSTSSSADNGTNADFHGHGISERSKRKLMESLSGTKSNKDVLAHPPGFSLKRARVEADDFGVKDKKKGVELLEGESNENKSEGHAKSCTQNTLEEHGMRLEERICAIENPAVSVCCIFSTLFQSLSSSFSATKSSQKFDMRRPINNNVRRNLTWCAIFTRGTSYEMRGGNSQNLLK